VEPTDTFISVSYSFTPDPPPTGTF